MHARNHWLPVALAALTAIGPFSIDTYLPAFQAMGSELDATQNEIQQTLTAYMASFAVMVLWHGALSDRFGRRPVLIGTTLLYALASVICALAPSIGWLWAGRVMQGVCAGAGMVVGRAMIRDLYDGAQAQRLMAQVMLIFGIAPAIAPLAGGALLELCGWRSIFVFLCALGIGLTWLCWRTLPETLPPEARQPFVPAALARAYREVLTHRDFMLLSLGISVIFNGYFLYVVSAPVFIREHLGLGSHGFAALFLPAVSCMMLGSFVSARLAGRWSAWRTIRAGLIIMAFASLVEIVLTLLPLPRMFILAPISLYNFGVAMIMPSLTLISLDLFPARRGLASSCQGFVQVGANALTTGILAPLLWGTPLILALGAGACYLLALLFFYLWSCQAATVHSFSGTRDD
ncbi:MAG: multidrug effflux MFS transporter [Azoarcus sp.]|jgi:DHA1 family bicyclomycin/chloramphenicol resistance-like MFS transporter|nr:multidrug effflux MFS transporter [Azoarcus sp.]